MTNRTTHWVIVGLTAAMLAAGLVLAPRLPSTMASHWNFAGEVDGTMSRTAALVAIPAMIAGIYLLFLAMIKILPLKENIAGFRPQLNLFFAGLGVLLAYLHAIVLAWNLDVRFPIEQAVLPGIAGLLFLTGHILGRAKRNWMFGIRTPWTLSSDRVWESTHRFGSLTFKLCAVLALVGAFLGPAAALMFIVPVALASLAVVVYSYLAWRREKA